MSATNLVWDNYPRRDMERVASDRIRVDVFRKQTSDVAGSLTKFS